MADEPGLNLAGVDAVLAAQRAAVADRVRATGMDADQLDEIDLVRDVMPEVLERIGEPRVVRSLANPDSKRATFMVEWGGGQRGILKVAGCDESAEGETLSQWELHGVPAVRQLHRGNVRGATYLVTEFTPAPALRDVFEQRLAREVQARRESVVPMPGCDALSVTLAEIIAVLAQAHISPQRMPFAPPLTERLRAPIREVTRGLGPVGKQWARNLNASMEELWQQSDLVVLHGDPWVGNLLHGAQGAVLLDPVGCIGPAEYDAAQAVAQITPPPRYAEMIKLACRVDSSLDPQKLSQWLGVYVSIEAGLARAGRSHVHPHARSEDSWQWTRRQRSDALAAESVRLLGAGQAAFPAMPPAMTAPRAHAFEL